MDRKNVLETYFKSSQRSKRVICVLSLTLYKIIRGFSITIVIFLLLIY